MLVAVVAVVAGVGQREGLGRRKKLIDRVIEIPHIAAEAVVCCVGGDTKPEASIFDPRVPDPEPSGTLHLNAQLLACRGCSHHSV